jgi:hypothetical protein
MVQVNFAYQVFDFISLQVTYKMAGGVADYFIVFVLEFLNVVIADVRYARRDCRVYIFGRLHFDGGDKRYLFAKFVGGGDLLF